MLKRSSTKRIIEDVKLSTSYRRGKNNIRGEGILGRMDSKATLFNMTLKEWIESRGISLIDFEEMSGVPYQRISEHIRLKRPLSEKHVIKILRATNCCVSPVSLRPSLRPIFKLINYKK